MPPRRVGEAVRAVRGLGDASASVWDGSRVLGAVLYVRVVYTCAEGAINGDGEVSSSYLTTVHMILQAVIRKGRVGRCPFTIVFTVTG